MNSNCKILFLMSLLAMFSCGKNEDNVNKQVDPSDPNALTSVLVIPGSTIENGSLPDPSRNTSSPVLDYNQPTLSTNSAFSF